MPKVYTLEDAQKAIRGLDDRFEPYYERYIAVLGKGDTDNTVIVPNRGGYYHYARPRGTGGAPQVVLNRITSARANLPVIIQRDPAQPETFKVVETAVVVPGYSVFDPGITMHNPQHTWGNDDGGDDLVWVDPRQIVGCRCGATDPASMEVEVGPGWYELNKTWYYFAGDTVDLTAYVPASNERWVVVALDDTGAIDVTSGDNVLLAQPEDIPETNGVWRSAAVRLTAGITSITDWPDTVRFVDQRFNNEPASLGALLHRWFIDGPLSVITESGGVWRIARSFAVTSAMLYVETIGTLGNTIIDVDYSTDDGDTWTSIFTNPANRPSVAGGGASHINVGTLATALALAVGDLVRMNIDEVATGVRNATVQLIGV